MSQVNWDGAFNLSDLGGMPTPDGATKNGRVFRSGRPETLTNQGWRDAKAAGLTTIVDLRNNRERARLDYDPIVGPEVLEGIDVILAPTEDPDDPEFMEVCGPGLDHPRSYPDNLAFYPEKFRNVFNAISHAKGSVLVHCSGGRDRTGMISAMLLSLAGVAPQVIADDYERAVRDANAYQAQHPERAREPIYGPEELDARIAERRTALIDWIGSFEVQSYLEEIGLSSVEIAQLTNLLL